MCGTISLPASIVSVSSGTSGHAPVQAFQRLHRGYFFSLFYCFRSSPRGPGVSVAHAHHPLPHRGPMTKLRYSKPQLCAAERTEPLSEDPLLRGLCRPRSPHESMPTRWLSPRPTVRHSFSRCLWMEIRYRWWRQQPLPLQPAKLISEEESQIKYCRTEISIFRLQSFYFSELRRGTVGHRGLQPVDNAIDRGNDPFLICPPRAISKYRSIEASIEDGDLQIS